MGKKRRECVRAMEIRKLFVFRSGSSRTRKGVFLHMIDLIEYVHVMKLHIQRNWKRVVSNHYDA